MKVGGGEMTMSEIGDGQSTGMEIMDVTKKVSGLNFNGKQMY